MKKLQNVLAILIRDIIVLKDVWYTEYTVKDGYYIYKWNIPFNITIGDYKFLSKRYYYNY